METERHRNNNTEKVRIIRQLDPQKLAKLPTFNEQLDKKYGKPGSDERNRFDEESLTWFYGNML
jgi:hypothetical protein